MTRERDTDVCSRCGRGSGEPGCGACDARVVAKGGHPTSDKAKWRPVG